MNMQQGAQRFGAETINAEVLSSELDSKEKTIHTSEGNYFAKAVIIATGARHKHLGVKKEEELTGRGVAYCAACDGMFYKDKVVAVVGGGNSAAADGAVGAHYAEEYLIGGF